VVHKNWASYSKFYFLYFCYNFIKLSQNILEHLMIISTPEVFI
jgi:hypothetical protein